MCYFTLHHLSSVLITDDQTNRNTSDQHHSTYTCEDDEDRWNQMKWVTCGIGRSIKSSSSLWSMTSDAHWDSSITPSPARLLLSYNHTCALASDCHQKDKLYNQWMNECVDDTWTHVWCESTALCWSHIWMKTLWNSALYCKNRQNIISWCVCVFVLNSPAALSSWCPDVHMINLPSGVYTPPVSTESCWCHQRHDTWWL